MKFEREFEIAYVGLHLGIHQYKYNINNSFFEHFDNTDFKNTNIEVKLTLDKKLNIFLLHFEVIGKTIVDCDRCGDEFECKLWDEFNLVIKQVDEHLVNELNEADAEIVHISKSESILNVAEWIYEFAILSIPLQHIHPNDASGKGTCNPIVLKLLKLPTEHSSNKMWEELKRKKIVNNKN